jgi:hypothetical protein
MSNITNTMNSNEIDILFHQCRPIPYYLLANNFYCQQPDFKKIYKSIILEIEEYMNEIGIFDYQFNPINSSWEIKYSDSSDITKILINVFWDDKINDHCVELNRITRSYMSRFSHLQLYENIRMRILDEKYIPPRVLPGRRLSLFQPPKLLIKNINVVSRDVMQERFMININRIIECCEDTHYEICLNGIKSLCDILNNHNDLLLLPYCLTNIVRVLKLLLEDEEFLIRELAMNALFDCVKLPEYVHQFQQNEYLSLLAKLIDDTEPLCDTNSYRRKAIYIADILDR